MFLIDHACREHIHLISTLRWQRIEYSKQVKRQPTYEYYYYQFIICYLYTFKENWIISRSRTANILISSISCKKWIEDWKRHWNLKIVSFILLAGEMYFTKRLCTKFYFLIWDQFLNPPERCLFDQSRFSGFQSCSH